MKNSSDKRSQQRIATTRMKRTSESPRWKILMLQYLLWNLRYLLTIILHPKEVLSFVIQIPVSTQIRLFQNMLCQLTDFEIILLEKNGTRSG